MPKKKRKKTKEERAQMKANALQKAKEDAGKQAQNLIGEMGQWEKGVQGFVERLDEIQTHLDEILPGYEERLKALKASSAEDKLSSEMIEGEPESIWSEKYTDILSSINGALSQYDKYQKLTEKSETILKDENLSDDRKLELATERMEMDLLWEKLSKQNLFVAEGACRLRFNSMIEQLYKTNARVKESTKSAKDMIGKTRQQIDELKNLSSKSSATVANLRKELDEQIQRNQKAIKHLGEEILDNQDFSNFYDNPITTFTPRAQISEIQRQLGGDSPNVQSLHKKVTEFDAQNAALKDNITAQVDAKNELVAVNKELRKQKAVLFGEKKKNEPQKKSVQSRTKKKLTLAEWKEYMKSEEKRIAQRKEPDISAFLSELNQWTTDQFEKGNRTIDPNSIPKVFMPSVRYRAKAQTKK